MFTKGNIMGSTNDLIIFGTGEIGILAKYYFEHDSDYTVVAFTADDEFVETSHFEGLPLVPFSRISDIYAPANYDLHVALSYGRFNQTREEKYIKAKERGYTLASYVCSKSVYWDDLKIGDNCFILENQTIQPTVIIGNNVMIWSGNHLGHGSFIDDHTYISSHVVISGHVNIGKRSFLGVNATIKDFCKIGSDVFIGMGAAVTSDISDGSIVVPPKSEIFGKNHRIAKKIRSKFFGV
jgi:sugar O-acyltransferase (sialic acid O-acetyltransferase NeuD family)